MSSTGSFEHLRDQLLVEGHVVSMFRSEFRAPNGEAFSREVVRHPGAVSVVPLLDDGDVVLVRQYRAPLDRFLLEIPEDLVRRDVKRGESSVSSQFNVRTLWESERARGFPSWKGKPQSSGGRSYDYGHEAAASSYEVKAAAGADGREIKVGAKVRHSSYGMGTVKQLEGSESDRKVTIEFTGRVVKKFSLRHVQLDLV